MGRDDDKFTSSTCGLSVPRQNGKNALLEMRELYGLCVLGERILHTSHAVKTSAEAFRRYSSFFENKEEYPWICNTYLDNFYRDIPASLNSTGLI